MALQTHHKALILVPVTIVVWLVVTFLTRPVDDGAAGLLLPQGPARAVSGGRWPGHIPDVVCDGFRWSRLGVWAGGCAGVYGFLFGLGKLVLGEPAAAVPLLSGGGRAGWWWPGNCADLT